jgi:hypothetical protein
MRVTEPAPGLLRSPCKCLFKATGTYCTYVDARHMTIAGGRAITTSRVISTPRARVQGEEVTNPPLCRIRFSNPDTPLTPPLDIYFPRSLLRPLAHSEDGHRRCGRQHEWVCISVDNNHNKLRRRSHRSSATCAVPLPPGAMYIAGTQWWIRARATKGIGVDERVDSDNSGSVDVVAPLRSCGGCRRDAMPTDADQPVASSAYTDLKEMIYAGYSRFRHGSRMATEAMVSRDPPLGTVDWKSYQVPE